MIDSFRGEYYFLSNFFSAPVTYNGLTFLNNEAAFQAQKCISPSDRKKFETLDPSSAKRMGRHVALRNDWESVKINIMRDIVYAKFTQNPDLAEKLLATGGEILVEGNTWGDRIWGKVDGVGRNLLGEILMETREKIRRDRL